MFEGRMSKDVLVQVQSGAPNDTVHEPPRLAEIAEKLEN
jgi:hypothetical protein